jgi:tRNA A37 threonylcarbamoyladenosine dehydratase
MIPERFVRASILFGESAYEKFTRAHVVLCGVGAVGTFALEALARSGIASFDLWDFDVVEESNINRQLCALSSTIGKRKAEVMRERILDINPAARVEIFPQFVDEKNAAEVVGKPDSVSVVVDAIDTLSAKAALICAANKAGVPIVSCMGAARRSDPSRIMVADIMKTFGCPVASRVRKLLRSNGYSGNCKCVFSDESISESTHLASAAEGSKKIIGSCAIVAGTFGLRLANIAVAEILAKK